MSLRRLPGSDVRERQFTEPPWIWDLLGVTGPWRGERELGGQKFVIQRGMPRSRALLSREQEQTKQTFGFKWKKRDTFDSPASLGGMRDWLLQRYGDMSRAQWLSEYGDDPLLLDAGCGAAFTTIELFGPLLDKVRYLGVDVSTAIDVAARRFAENGYCGAFMQADLMRLPLPDSCVDMIYSEGVLHHTDSTKDALCGLTRLLKPGGRILFYIYHRKGPLREFTDDYIRAKLQAMTPDEAWKALEPLTSLGVALAELDATVEITEPIELLDIPAGKYDLQRFFYWHVAKAFYRPDISFDEMNHINYDWYAPANATRHNPDEVRSWCTEFGLNIEREVVEPSGITVIARKAGH